MFHSRRVNNKTNNLNELSLRVVYKDNYISYVDLFPKDKSCTILQRNIHSLEIELFKVKRSLSNVKMSNNSKARTLTYTLRLQTDFAGDCVNTRSYGPNSLSYFAPGVWNMIPSEIKY